MPEHKVLLLSRNLRGLAIYIPYFSGSYRLTGKLHCLTINSLMSKVNVPLVAQKGKKLGLHDDLRGIINNSDYDAEFWEKNPVVKRTDFEESVIKMFESKSLLGKFQ